MSSAESVEQEEENDECENTVLTVAVEYFPIRSNIITLKRNYFNHELLAGPVDDRIIARRVFDTTLDYKHDVLESASKVEKKNDCTGRKFFVMRHAERLDRIFPEWIKKAFPTADGQYVPYDLNMPSKLPFRSDYNHYVHDTPLTEVGYLTSQMIGRAIRVSGHTVDQIYCSPSLRCVQTAHCLIKMCRKGYSCKINVEPGLFEFLASYKETPTFMTNEEYLKNGYEINVDYKSFMNVVDLRRMKSSESIFSYYQRSQKVMEYILERETNEWSNFLVVAHASSLDACTRRLLAKRSSLPTKSDMYRLGQIFPYLSIVRVEEDVDAGAENEWRLVDRVLANLSYYKNDNRIRGNFLKRP